MFIKYLTETKLNISWYSYIFKMFYKNKKDLHPLIWSKIGGKFNV